MDFRTIIKTADEWLTRVQIGVIVVAIVVIVAGVVAYFLGG
jgi:heme/copper-type cytochrome/quinol oxidase subunit 2